MARNTAGSHATDQIGCELRPLIACAIAAAATTATISKVAVT
jgi:hypothetical protein